MESPEGDNQNREEADDAWATCTLSSLAINKKRSDFLFNKPGLKVIILGKQLTIGIKGE